MALSYLLQENGDKILQENGDGILLEQQEQIRLQKRYFYKFYDVNRQYLGTLDDTLISNLPSFTWSVNGGMGNVSLNFATTIDSDDVTNLINGQIPSGQTISLWDSSLTWDGDDAYWDASPGVNSDVHSIDIYVVDETNIDGLLVWSGVLKQVEQNVSANGSQSVVWNCYTWLTEAATALYENADGDTTITHNSTDPSNMFKDVIDRLNAKKDFFTYDSDSIQLTGTKISYEFKYVSCKEALDKIIELCPDNWVYYLDADRKFHLFKADTGTTATTHEMTLGVEFNEFKGTIDRSGIVNKIYFKGGDTGGGTDLYKLYTRTGSVSSYQAQEIMMTDSRVIVEATAETKASRVLNEREAPVKEVSISIPDDNTFLSEIKGYDLESLKPGDSISLVHPTLTDNQTLWDSDDDWDSAYWDSPPEELFRLRLYINEINYNSLVASLNLKIGVPTFEKRQEDLERNIKDEQSLNIPDAPT